MIILATISINAVLGDNGIIKRAESARQHQLNAEASDNEALDELDKYFANAMAGEGNGNSGNQEPLGISYRIEDIDVSGKAVILDYLTTASLETKVEELKGTSISEDIKNEWKALAESNNMTYDEILLEVILFGEPNEEARAGGKSVAESEGMSYKELLIQTIEQNGILLLPRITATAKNGTHEVTGVRSEFIATRNGTYTVKAIAEDGRQAEIEVNITGIEEEKFSEIYETTTTYTKGDLTAKIPAGFAVGVSEGINTIEDGLVITDAVDGEGYSIGNEYVWIPVESDETFIRENFNNEISASSWADYTEPLSYNGATGYANETTEYNTMRTQVIANHGFYIGRYESGVDTATLRSNPKEGVQEVVIKRGTAPYNYVPWGASMSDINSDVTVYKYDGNGNKTEETVQTKGAVYLSQNMYNGKTQANSVTSTLIYGVQWDAMCRFIEDYTRTTPNKNGVDLTGRIGGDNSKNIYDLAGNCYEWTMEANLTNHRVARGFPRNGKESVYIREGHLGPERCVRDGKDSFRCALYVN